eukprot:EG_transcript_6949
MSRGRGRAWTGKPGGRQSPPSSPPHFTCHGGGLSLSGPLSGEGLMRSELLWIMLMMPTKTLKHGREREEEKYVGQAYLDLSKFTIGKNLHNIPMTSEKFDLTISIRTLAQSENPRIFRHMTRVPSEVQFRGVSGGAPDEEPSDRSHAAKKKWLLEQRTKLEGDLRRTMQELNRETDAALADNKRKQEQLTKLQHEMEELEKRRQDKAPVEVMRRAQEDKRTGVGGQLASLLKSRQCQPRSPKFILRQDFRSLCAAMDMFFVGWLQIWLLGVWWCSSPTPPPNSASPLLWTPDCGAGAGGGGAADHPGGDAAPRGGGAEL